MELSQAMTRSKVAEWPDDNARRSARLKSTATPRLAASRFARSSGAGDDVRGSNAVAELSEADCLCAHSASAHRGWS